MKIYIVTCGEYSDYGVLAAFLDKTKAEAFVEKYNRGHGIQARDDAEIEEYEDGVPFDFETLNVYAVRFYDNGSYDIVKKGLHNVYDFQTPLPRIYACYGYGSSLHHKHLVEVAAKDEAHAFKIACDGLAKWKAENEGL